MSDGLGIGAGYPEGDDAGEDDWATGHYDLWAGDGGSLLRTHGRDVCAGDPCPLHLPGPHHMRRWRLRLRREAAFPAERLCPHGHWHPDPDDQAFRLTRLGRRRVCEGCDGCCEGEAGGDGDAG